MKGMIFLEIVTWIVFMLWASLYFIRESAEPLEFFGLCVGIGLLCIAHAIRDLRSPWYDIKDLLNKRKEEK